MKLAYRVLNFALVVLVLFAVASAQSDDDKRSVKDNRNTAPTVGTGGPMGGPTGLFTVYDGQTLRKGEYTFSAALSNYDRDPGNVDLTEVPISFQIGVTNNFEVFFNTEAYRALKVNSPRNLSSFLLPNSQFNLGSGLTSGPAIILGPVGSTAGPFSNLAVFRPAGSQPFVVFPFVGGPNGDFGQPLSGPLFGFPAGTNPQISAPQDVNGASANFPGMGSVFGSILPGVVFQTAQIINPFDESTQTIPTSFLLAPSYLPDAPFINRTYGESAFGTFTVGGKWRFNSIDKPYGLGVVIAYRFYNDKGDDFSGFNQLQRGASPGGDKGDLLVTAFADGRIADWFNVSGNLGYHINSAVKGDFPSGKFTILDRPDELLGSVGVDFPINKYFQPIAEFRATKYVGGRTPNALEKDPMDVIAGFRIYPTRWMSFGVAYRANLNQQDEDFFDSDDTVPGNAIVICSSGSSTQPGATLPPGCVPTVVTNNTSGIPPGFQLSDNPHGYIAQFTIGRRNAPIPEKFNEPANVTGITLSDDVITLPCAAGFVPREGHTCDDNTTVSVATAASDPENDVLTYNYTVSGGRIVGSGANVSWDLGGLQPGTYTITSAVDDGCGFCGKAETKTITIEACDCVPVCNCPTFTVSGPAGVTLPGDAMTFTASVTGGPEVTYNWTVSGGVIESGQGTPSIVVRTSRADAGTNITATLNLGGLDPNCECQKDAFETAPVDKNPEAVQVDEFGKLSNDDIRARLDQFFIELQNNPANQGYIINYGNDKDIAAREKIITNHIDFRKFDRTRITLVRGGDTGEGPKTKLYRVPEGAENPNP